MDKNTIFITGAAAGIGKETALLFAQKGWFVGLYDINEAALTPLVEAIGQDQCCAGRIDVSSIDAVQKAIEHFAEVTKGRFNVLFNNAGIIHAGAIDEISLEDQKRLIDINVWGVLNCTIQALPYLKTSTPARIVNMSSASAIYGHPALTAYAASKMAVRSMTQGLDLGLARHGIKVADIMPIWVHTNLAQDAANQWKGLTMAEVKITPQKVAQTVWNAVHRSRLHWLLGAETRFYNFLTKVLPNRLTRLTAGIVIKD